ncbi:hypothetical protein [Mesorhizobium sp. M0500]|uniref:hypothetical protein n=1 Tax=Mesorhizobium sp. M0500 TaxID=2956953 RepID=UPI00333A72CB
MFEAISSPANSFAEPNLVHNERRLLKEVALCRPVYYDWAAENAPRSIEKLSVLLILATKNIYFPVSAVSLERSTCLSLVRTIVNGRS